MLFFQLIPLVLPVRVAGSIHRGKSAMWAVLFIPRTLPFVHAAVSGEALLKRAFNKTVWIPAKAYQGSTFFDEWEFFTGDDYTHGPVDYVGREEATRAGLISITPEGRAIMQVDNVTRLTLDEINTKSKLRPSVRISTKAVYNHGLFILDVAQAPYGCGIWPAFWSTSYSPNWPQEGEIDILENVHNNPSNQVSWHTTANCQLTSPGNFTGTALSTVCEVNATSNIGCNIVDPSVASFGPTFNEKGGGVFAMKWDSDSVDVWFFYRSAIPDNVLGGIPDPAAWPLPSASLSGLGCPIDRHFMNHALIFDITLCGDWGGPSYALSGCPGTCQERVTDPANFVNATWSINSLKVYNKTVIDTTYLGVGTSLMTSISSVWYCSIMLMVCVLLQGQTWTL